MKHNILIISLFAFSCSSGKEEIWGMYVSDVSKIESLFNNHVDGSKLTIYKDSTFTRQDCAQITKGHWSISNDSLYLYCEDIRFIVDSLNYDPKYRKGTICGTEPDVFYIDNNVLKRTQVNKDGTSFKDYLKKE